MCQSLWKKFEDHSQSSFVLQPNIPSGPFSSCFLPDFISACIKCITPRMFKGTTGVTHIFLSKIGGVWCLNCNTIISFLWNVTACTHTLCIEVLNMHLRYGMMMPKCVVNRQMEINHGTAKIIWRLKSCCYIQVKGMAIDLHKRDNLISLFVLHSVYQMFHSIQVSLRIASQT